VGTQTKKVTDQENDSLGLGSGQLVAKARLAPKGMHFSLGKVVVFTNIFLLALVLWAYISFGSLRIGLAFLRGEKLLPDAYSKSFGTVEAGKVQDVVFNLKNHSSTPISLIGSSSSCSCVVTGRIVGVVPAGGEWPLRVTVRTAGRKGDISEKLNVFTDSPSTPQVHLRVAGRVVPGE